MVSGITKSIAENCADITGYAPGDGKGNEIMQSIAKIGEEVKERQKKRGCFSGTWSRFFHAGVSRHAETIQDAPQCARWRFFGIFTERGKDKMARIYEIRGLDGSGICSLSLAGRDRLEIGGEVRKMFEKRAKDISPGMVKKFARGRGDRLKINHENGVICGLSPEEEEIAHKIKSYVDQFKGINRGRG